jgi:hypothetical protein
MTTERDSATTVTRHDGEARDGNALGAMLMDVFGREMTDAPSCCAGCDAVHALGALLVYDRAPGAVIRCPSCGSVMMVAVERPAGLRFNFAGLRWVESVQR